MSRRSRQRVVRQGAPYIRANAVQALPLTHESVRRFLFNVSPLLQRKRPRALFDIPPLAKRAFRKSRMYEQLGALAIGDPRKALFCVRRKTRREVMFARGVAGSSGRMRGKKFRRSQDSQYRC